MTYVDYRKVDMKLVHAIIKFETLILKIKIGFKANLFEFEMSPKWAWPKQVQVWTWAWVKAKYEHEPKVKSEHRSYLACESNMTHLEKLSLQKQHHMVLVIYLEEKFFKQKSKLNLKLKNLLATSNSKV